MADDWRLIMNIHLDSFDIDALLITMQASHPFQTEELNFSQRLNLEYQIEIKKIFCKDNLTINVTVTSSSSMSCRSLEYFSVTIKDKKCGCYFFKDN